MCRFVIVFGLLIAPWPGWPETYARCLQKSATTVFGSFGSKGIVTFTWNPSGEKWLHKVFDTTIYVSNREQISASYPWPGAVYCTYSFSSRAMAYLPTALVVALVLATGIGWRRRLWALVWGLVWIHLFIAFLLWLIIVMMICMDPVIDLFEVSPFWQKAVLLLREFFFNNASMPLATAVLIWMVVSFRRDDWSSILGKKVPVPTNAPTCHPTGPPRGPHYDMECRGKPTTRNVP
ncbi:MAG: hypothetical protein ABSH11_11005 [Verrucomicrobiota bacterium]